MKLRDKVKWTSQAGGYKKTKEGEIFCIVPAGTPVSQACPEIRLSKAWGGGVSRNHESYVVKVGKKLYWPFVNLLRMADTGESLLVVEEKLSEDILEQRSKWPAWMTN